jgi:predicted ATPase/class 3 adenylate cyclase
MRNDLPSGTVTFLFTDVEGSTKLLHSLGAEAYAEALAEHRRLIREACARHDGVEVDTQGDAFFVAFGTAPGALAAAEEMTRELASGSIQVRIGVHTGTPILTDEGYVGGDVHRAARIAAAGHGGQVLVSSSTAPLVEIELTDLGEHRFKDLGAAERVYQLGDGEFPALKSLYRTNLPVPATPFLGRERELAEVVGLLEGTRLLTLTGPGGTGKTRLASQAAGLASDSYPDGVWWVPLAPLSDPRLVTETTAQILGSANGLEEHIADREMLCLLDNFEQVVEAAPDLSSLVASCPNLTLLVTSRELLRVQGEVEYRVPPLAPPEAVELFCTRSRLDADEAIAELCRHLDDLPLAVELAAARTSVLSPRQILERLSTRLDLLKGGRDADPRQATLRATIEWSFELLTSEEQRLFARLAVFSGGCTLEAAEEVAEADLDTLQSLVDKSLLRHTEERFWMLETIREYASERLEASGDAEDLQRRHAEHFLALAEEAEPHLRKESEESREWLDRFDPEHDNVRAALDGLDASGEHALVLQLAGAVWWFWDDRGHYVEGRRRVESALAADQRPTAARARALNGAGELAMNAGDVAAARPYAEEALALNRALGDVWGTAFSAYLLGHANLDFGEAAQPLIEEGARLFREAGDEFHSLFATHLLGWSFYRLGDSGQAQALWEDNLERSRTTGDRYIEALTLGTLANNLALEEGRVEVALSMLADAYYIHRDLGTPAVQTAMNLGRLAHGLAVAGRAVAAAWVLASAEALYEEVGAGKRPIVAENDEKTLSTIREQLDEAAFAEAWEQGRALSPDEAVALALEESADA